MKLALLLVLVSGAAAAAERGDQQTLGGAYQRARARLDLVNRAVENQRQNRGTPARNNAIRDEQRQGELPWLQPKPLSGW